MLHCNDVHWQVDRPVLYEDSGVAMYRHGRSRVTPEMNETSSITYWPPGSSGRQTIGHTCTHVRLQPLRTRSQYELKAQQPA